MNMLLSIPPVFFLMLGIMLAGGFVFILYSIAIWLDKKIDMNAYQMILLSMIITFLGYKVFHLPFMAIFIILTVLAVVLHRHFGDLER